MGGNLDFFLDARKAGPIDSRVFQVSQISYAVLKFCNSACRLDEDSPGSYAILIDFYPGTLYDRAASGWPGDR
jgi:hypothetical protein